MVDVEGPKLPTMAVTLGMVDDGSKGRAYRRGGYRSR